MLAIKLKNNQQICMDIAIAYKKQRLMKNMTREMLAKSAGISESTVKNFETTGRVNLDSLISISKALDKNEIIKLLVQTDSPQTIQEFKNQNRKRSRI